MRARQQVPAARSGRHAECGLAPGHALFEAGRGAAEVIDFDGAHRPMLGVGVSSSRVARLQRPSELARRAELFSGTLRRSDLEGPGESFAPPFHFPGCPAAKSYL